MTAPPDADKVIDAFRLGWTLAEVRGRYRPGIELIRQPPAGKRTDHALPLADERSEAEQLIELHNALKGLSDSVAVGGTLAVPGGDSQTYSARIAQLGAQLRHQSTPSLWDQFTETVYEWDAFIQDTLVINAPQAAAYQLGRGLADTYWALDPRVDDASEWNSWQFLLGPRRCHTLGRLIARLVDYVDPLTVPAVTTSLDAWATVAADPELRHLTTSLDALYDQMLLWRDLVRSERRPEDLAASRNPVAWSRIVVPVIKAFWVQIVVAGVGAALLAVSAAELAAGSATKGNAFVAVLSGLGITSAALYARAKGIANSLVGQLKTAFERDRVGGAATLAPKPARTLAVGAGRTKPAAQIDSASPRLEPTLKQ